MFPGDMTQGVVDNPDRFGNVKELIDICVIHT